MDKTKYEICQDVRTKYRDISFFENIPCPTRNGNMKPEIGNHGFVRPELESREAKEDNSHFLKKLKLDAFDFLLLTSYLQPTSILLLL